MSVDFLPTKHEHGHEDREKETTRLGSTASRGAKDQRQKILFFFWWNEAQ